MSKNILDRRETFYGDKNIIPFKSQKSHILCKRINLWC